MAQPTASAGQTNYHNDISPAWLDREIQVRLETRVAAGHPWKQLLQTASDETIREVYQTLQAYTVLWYPLQPRKTDSVPFDKATALDLLKMAEQDLKTGLSFIREVEKGSHTKAESVLRFRPEATKALCGLCQSRVEALKPGRNDDDEQGDGEDEEDQKGGGNCADPMGGARAHRVGKVLVGTIYRDIETELKTHVQLLIHQQKRKTRSK